MNWFARAREYLRRSEAAKAPALLRPADRPRGSAPIVRPRGRQTYQTQGTAVFQNPWSRVPETQNFNLYAAIREAIPITDVMITKTRQLIGCPVIDADPETKREIDAWLETLTVNTLQMGWTNFLNTWVDNGLCYGRAHTEIILNSARDDIFALRELHPKTISLRPKDDFFSIEIVQSQPFAGEPVVMNPLRMLNYIHDVRGDDPSGTSILWGLPFVAEIIQKLLKNLGSTWDRYGTPRYHINWEPPDDFPDPNGDEADEILSDLAAQFNQALISGVQGDIVDFYTAGKVTVSIVGAEGDTLVFEAPMKSLTQQVLMKSHIPPVAFGLDWAMGEQTTQLQADLLTQLINSLRAEITPQLNYLIDLRQKLGGRDREFKLIWPTPTLIDIFAKARADFFTENSRQLKIANNNDLWRQGQLTVHEVVRSNRPEFAHLMDDEIDARLPDLKQEPPEDMPPGETGPGRTGTGGGGGLNPGSATGRELERAMHEERIYRSNTRNGNGTH